MVHEIILTKTEYLAPEFRTDELLTSKRYPLDARIRHYYKKEDGQKVYDALKKFILTQTAVARKLEQISGQKSVSGESNSNGNGRTGLEVLLSMGLGAALGEQYLNHQDQDNTDFFSNKRINYLQSFPSPVNKALELYLNCLDEGGSTHTLEGITASFFSWIQEDVGRCLDEKGYPKTERRIDLTIDSDKYALDLNLKAKEEHKINFPAEKFFVESGTDGNIVKKIDAEKKIGVNGQNSNNNPQTPGSASSNVLASSKVISLAPEDFDCDIYGHDQVTKEFLRVAAIVANRDYLLDFFYPDPRSPDEGKELFGNYLLFGPPGTGKTTLVLNLAKRCGLEFMKIPCVELGSKYFSETASRIHEVYSTARRKIERDGAKGVIVFFDEFDHIAKLRGRGESYENDSMITTLNENLDGGSRKTGIVTIGATNVLNLIDPAILNKMKTMYVGYPETDEGVIGIHQTVIRKMERRAGKRIFEELDYPSLLEFSHRDERYKSGRVINNLIYKTALDKAIVTAGQAVNNPALTIPGFLVNTEDLLRSYQSYELDAESGGLSVRHSGRGEDPGGKTFLL